MRQFDVLPNPSVQSRANAPFLVVPQSHHLNMLDSAILAPAIRDADRPLGALDVMVDFNGQGPTIAIAELASVHRLGLPAAVGSLRDYEDDIRRALDRLFTGF